MIEIDGSHLTLLEVLKVARFREPVSLSAQAKDQMENSHAWVDEIMGKNDPVYGINTGFGVFADRKIPAQEIAQLNRNLILSHAVGTGPALAEEVVRAAMLIRANTLAKDYSGVRQLVVETLLEMLNRGVVPFVPEQGSMGSSGDLGPLSFLALVFSTDDRDLEQESGLALYQGKWMTGKAAMLSAGIPRLQLGPKEGLGINNGATFSAALLALAVMDARNLVDTADLALSMSLEAVLGCSAAFDARIQDVRGFTGQKEVAARVRKMTQGSSLLDSTGRVQDAYSLRCSPQVHGSVRDTLELVSSVAEREINAVTDNPILFEQGMALSGGNFHGAPIGMAADYLKIALSVLSSISERRVFRLTDSRLSAGLPPMLVDKPEEAGLNSGLMMPQYMAASLTLENRNLATPDSVNSLPTSAAQEDLNANSMTAARHLRQSVQNTAAVLAIELLTATWALHLRIRTLPKANLGKGVQAAFDFLQSQVPYVPADTWWQPHIDRVLDLVTSGEISMRAADAIQDR